MNSEHYEFVKTEKHTGRAYDLIAPRYAEVWFDRPSKPLADRFLSYLPSTACILDAGCGPGQYTKYFWDQGKKAIGIDISMETLVGARKRCGRSLFVRNSLSSLAFADEVFDAVWACASLMHVPEERVRFVLSEVCRVLRPGGLLFTNVQMGSSNRIEEPAEFNQGGSFGRFFQRYPDGQCFEKHLITTGYKVISFWEATVESQVLSNARDRTPHWLNYIASRT